MGLGRAPAEMAVCSACKLIYPQVIVRAAGRPAGERQPCNFGVWGCLHIVYAHSRCVYELGLAGAALSRAIWSFPSSPEGPRCLSPAQSPREGILAPPAPSLAFVKFFRKSQLVYMSN